MEKILNATVLKKNCTMEVGKVAKLWIISFLKPLWQVIQVIDAVVMEMQEFRLKQKTWMKSPLI
jgi:hypothetical protein